MLKTLTVWNFALLEHVQIEFGSGLNILTGETGAGKSILIDSLGAILGHRISADFIRTDCDWLRVEAVFSLEGQYELISFLETQAIDVEDDTLIITRQITRSGKNMILVNGCHVTLAVLRGMGRLLIDIHGQNENLALLRMENQFALLDGSDEAIEDQLESYGKCFTNWQELCRQLLDKEQASRDYAQRLDMLKWQDKEISEAKLKEGEDKELEQDILKLSNAEKITGYITSSDTFLNGGGKSPVGVLEALARIKQNLESLSRFDSSMEESRKMVEDAYCQLQEVSYNLRDYGDDMDFDAHKLDRLESRMDVIDKLRKKYGATLEAVLDHQKEVQAELADIENYDDDIAVLKKRIFNAQEEVRIEAAKLTKMRCKAADKLSVAIETQLLALGMPNARFHIVLEPLKEASARGADALIMLFSANAGETEKTLQKVASGGELARIALAVKTVEAAQDDSVASMVFDEIDAGIGGRTAQMVAERIALVSVYKQVLCITHLPQIACMADVHLYISKETQDGKTTTAVRILSEGERINEIARMASGIDVTAASLDNAREMVDNARIKKHSFKNGKNRACRG